MEPDPIEVCRIEFRGTKTPFSARFNDVYFAEDQGILESELLYLQGAGVFDRIQSEPNTLTVGEVGFGVGLNFLLTLKAFQNSAQPNSRLFYFSAEQYPVHLDDLLKLYSNYPELHSVSKALLDQYPTLTPGVHCLKFFNGRVHLYLMLGSALQQFEKLNTPIEHWYWDGFAPSRNPDAFSEPLFQVLAARSAPNATGSSFTSATWVRRGLEQAGFKIEKHLGFGNKRERITAKLVRPGHFTSPLAPWFRTHTIAPLKPGLDVIQIAGAGLAGSAAARAFADRGFQVTVYDPNGVAKRASGNSIGLFNVQMSRKPNPISRFSQASLTHFLGELKRFDLPVHFGIERSDTQDELALKTSIYPEDFYETQADRIFLPQCGMLSPRALCEARLNHPNIKVIKSAISTAACAWTIHATGADLKLGIIQQHPILDGLPARPIRGQILELSPDAASSKIHFARVHHGYVTPVKPEITGEAFHCLGATYQAKGIAENQTEIDTHFLIEEAKRSWPEFSNLDASRVLRSREGYRLSTPDKLPMIGPLIDATWARDAFRAALQGARQLDVPEPQYLQGHAVLLGLGSRGITFSSLSAEILASTLTGEPLPIESDLWEHLHPARFLFRDLKRAPRFI